MNPESLSELETAIKEDSAKFEEIKNQLERNLEIAKQFPAFKTLEEQKEIDAKSVYVGNVDWSSTTEDIENHFKECGTIVRVTIPKDKFTKLQKNFAYIEFDSVEAVQNALLLDATLLLNRPIAVAAKRTNLPGMSRAAPRRGPRRNEVFVEYVYEDEPTESHHHYHRGGSRGYHPY